MRGSHLPHPKFSLQSGMFSLSYAMRIMFGMFLFAFWVFSTLKHEPVIFSKFRSAYMYASPLDYLDTPILLMEHMPCMCCACSTRHQ